MTSVSENQLAHRHRYGDRSMNEVVTPQPLPVGEAYEILGLWASAIFPSIHGERWSSRVWYYLQPGHTGRRLAFKSTSQPFLHTLAAFVVSRRVQHLVLSC